MRGKVKYVILLVFLMALIYIQQTVISNAEENIFIEDANGEENKEIEAAIENYELSISEMTGNNGYYVVLPEVGIVHKDENNVTKYQLICDDEVQVEGELTGKDEVIKIEEFKEGRNVLRVWMEDLYGGEVRETFLEKEFLIDTKVPELQVSVPKGFDAWYLEKVNVSVEAFDSGSQVEFISCSVDGNTIGTIEKNRGSFSVTKASSQGNGVSVVLEVMDRAGNRSQIRRTLYIDAQAPTIDIKGVQDYMITSESAKITYEAEDENKLASVKASVVRKDESGNMINLDAEDWRKEQILSEDGLYQLRLEAVDQAGHVSKKEMQIIIDKTNPVIKYVDNLHQQHIRNFVWTHSHQEFIWDFTTYTYEMRVDGKLYYLGEKLQTEGRHLLEVRVKDEAGNESIAKASFVIDHTKPKIYFKNAEEGQEYEEERTFQVVLANEEDTIEEIQINGKKQEIHSGQSIYEYTLQESLDYEIRVKAKDKAGNASEESIHFTIIPKTTVIEKITEPIRRSLEGEDFEEEPPEDVKEELPFMLWAGLGTAGMLIVVGGFIWWKNMRVNLEETEEEQFEEEN